ncbi:glutamate receptor ionotropic, kainate 2-like isoform X2 [Belonocnema kinseyi]|nr:glutamate receptor ionotropic, kainate 2-like isoform X2 [Belonocnema kinseyi]
MLWNYILVAFLPFSLGYNNFRIGGVFEGYDGIGCVFGKSASTLREILGSDPKNLTKYVTTDEELKLWDVQTKVCELMEKGVVAIFGPLSPQSLSHAYSMCDAMGIPHIATTLSIDDKLKSINFYPHSEALSTLYYDLVVEYNWKTYTILYENKISLLMIKPLLERWNSTGYTVSVRLLNGPDYRRMLRDVKLSGEQNFIIDCSVEILPEVLKQALQVGLLFHKFNLIITSLDLQTINYQPYQYSGMNITALRLIDPDNELVQIINYKKPDCGKLTTNKAVMYDAVQFVALAFKNLTNSTKKIVRSLPCDGSEIWEHGETLTNYIRTGSMEGLTGIVKFDTRGYRSEFAVDILNLGEDGLKKIGIWNSTRGFKWIPKPVILEADTELSLHNQTFRVLISLTKPYASVKDSLTKRVGNDRFEGYTVDIIDELSKMCGFNYTFMVQDDKNYGSYNNFTGEWNGMIGKIRANEADLAIADLTITQQREEAVDFTLPFMSLGISILYRRPTKAEGSLLSFLSPLTLDVWFYLTAAYIFVSIELVILGRLSSAEWVNPYPCIDEPQELKNQLTFSNCLWFTLGALMQQGSEIAPVGMSTRLLAGCWWFFCLIMVSSYTANLASSLTYETPVQPFRDAFDLARQSKIKYGAKKGGSTLAFFQGSDKKEYRHIYETMMNDAKNCLTSSNEEGVEKVKTEDFAFFMESSTIEYETERDCSLTKIGPQLDEKGYGIAMRKNSPYRHDLIAAILELQENGKLSKLKLKWWSEKHGGGSCVQASSSVPSELNLKNVGGVYLVLFIGIGISFIWTIIELLLYVAAQSHEYNISFKEELIKELKFVIQFNRSSKPVRRRAPSRRSGISTTECASIDTSNTNFEDSVC